MHRYVMDLAEADRSHAAVVGGKGANLGELSRIDGIRVPGGFCVTTAAFRRLLADAPHLGDELGRLARLEAGDREAIGRLSAEVRTAIEAIDVPREVDSEVRSALERLGVETACAVRSSATAEDLPTASFAGQQDTFLNVVGPTAILRQVRRCWASLFTERAVMYRLRNGFDHRRVAMAVVVQRMVLPRAAGVLFTADPVTGNRAIASIEAAFGLGEALVAGLVTPDVYRVRGDEIVGRTPGTKRLALRAAAAGGTRQEPIEPGEQARPALTDAQVVRLAHLGRRIEAHFGSPQDVEWCLTDTDSDTDDDGTFHFVQSRPITTLFPVPEASDGESHVYLSVGHQQMMTDAMKPLGISFWRMTTPAPVREAGGRLFVDVTRNLASPASREALLGLAGRSDPLILDALRTILDRGDFIPSLPDPAPAAAPEANGEPPPPLPTDPGIVRDLIARSEASLVTLKQEIRTKSGTELLDFIRTDIQELRRILFDPGSHRVFMTAIEATWWLNEHLEAWLGQKNAADALAQSVPDNVTSEMGLALLDVADAIRPHPELVAFLKNTEREDFLDVLPGLPGGRAAREAIRGWLDRYGMRCIGEIDITRPRWAERPSLLIPLILGNVRSFEPGEAVRRFDRGRREAAEREGEILERLRGLPDGTRKAAETKAMIDRVRTFIGYREYPKYGMISRYFVYKLALLGEAARLVRAGVLGDPSDVFFLTFDELQDVVRTNEVDDHLIRRRREQFRTYQALRPPRVLTSEGEMIDGSYRRDDLPPGALVGLPVSSGTIEGRARIILDITDADLEAGDILVTAFTDPSWTPLFVAIGGLVTEVGGLMTHGAVIAREYGLPAVVGVDGATRRIRDGQRIRVDGTEGFVEILD